jgi:hypothetical protein
MPSSEMLRRVALVRANVSEERVASIITVIIIDELGTTLGVTSNHNTLRRNTILNFVIGIQAVKFAINKYKFNII